MPNEQTFDISSEPLDAVGGLPFYVVPSAALSLPADAFDHLVSSAYAELNAKFSPGAEGPRGLAAIVTPEVTARRPEAVWTDPPMLYAGALAGGLRLRIAYFEGALVRPLVGPFVGPERWDVEPDVRIELFAEQDTVSAQDMIDLWVGEGVLPADEAARRVDEILLVAIDDDGKPVGVATRYLQESAQLRMPMWFGRIFVASSHRRRATAGHLSVAFREVLGERFTSGRDTRAAGAIFEIENPVLEQVWPQATWRPAEMTFIGVNDAGLAVRVHWFAGARVPV